MAGLHSEARRPKLDKQSRGVGVAAGETQALPVAKQVTPAQQFPALQPVLAAAGPAGVALRTLRSCYLAHQTARAGGEVPVEVS